MATTNIDAREILTSIALQEPNWNLRDKDRCILSAGNEFMRRTKLIQKTDATTSFTTNSADVTLAISDFRVERLIRAEVSYPDEGTWTSGTVYAVNDLVTGDGSPDSYLYIATTAHTASASNEPPSSSWQRVNWKGGYLLEHVNYGEVARLLNENIGSLDVNSVVTVNPGRPTKIAFQTQTAAKVWPVPDTTWGLRLIYFEPFTSWTPGDNTLVTLNIPDEYIYPVIQFGALSYLHLTDQLNSRITQEARARFEEFIASVKGGVGLDGGIDLADINQYV